MHAIEAVAVMACTLALVVVRPRDLNEGLSALIGGVLVLVLGLVPVPEAVQQVLANWNVFLFFLGMMGIASLADHAGVFDVIAYRTALLSGGRVRALFVAIFIAGALISLVFANDSAALVLTPIVYALVVRLSLDPLPFVFATTFVADTASLGLPVSNPLNVIVADGFHLGLGSYVVRLWLPALLVTAINLLIFLLLFRRGTSGSFRRLPDPPRKAIRSSVLVLVLLAAAYLAASAAQFPLGIVAVAGCLLLAGEQARLKQLDVRRLAGDISWPIFGFIAGMLVVVQGLHDSGVTAALGHAMVRAAGHADLQALAVTVVGTAAGSNLINNLPMGLVMVSTVHEVHVSSAVRADMIYGTIAGCDLGPNLTHLGSLATFLWLFFLRRKGLEVSTLQYFKIGMAVTPLMLAAAVFGLWVTAGARL